MPPITSPEDTTPLEKKSSTFALTESENSLITALDSKDSWFSTLSEEELDLDSDHFFSKDSLLIMVKNPKSDSPFILPPKSQLQLLNPTTPFFPPTPSLNTPMSLLCSTTKLFTISAEDNSILKDPPTPTLTDLLPKLSHPSLLPSDSTEP